MKKYHTGVVLVRRCFMFEKSSGTKLDKIRNERIRGTAKVGEMVKKVQERRLKWYKVKVWFYIALYPVRWTAQSALHFLWVWACDQKRGRRATVGGGSI